MQTNNPKKINVVMNYFPSNDYWLLEELRTHGINYKLFGNREWIRQVRYRKFWGNFIWNLYKLIRGLIISFKIKKGSVTLILDDTASSVFIAIFSILFMKSNLILCLNMIDNLNGNSIKGILYRLAFKKMYASVNNKSLIDKYVALYHLNSRRFFILPDCYSNWGRQILKDPVSPENKNYVFMGGSSYRDWNLFIETAEELKEYHFIGAARKGFFPNVPIPSNVRMYFDVKEIIFRKLLKNCTMIFMPINVKTQGGQIVLMEGALYKKPVCTTDSVAIRSYIKNGIDGELIPIFDKAAAVKSIKKIMSNEKLQLEYGKNFYAKIIKLSPENFVNDLLHFIQTVQ